MFWSKLCKSTRIVHRTLRFLFLRDLFYGIYVKIFNMIMNWYISKSYKNTIDQRHTDWGQLKCQLLLVIHLIIFIDNLNLIVVLLVGRVTVVKITKTMIYQSTGLQERKDDIINHLYINFRALMQYLRGVFVLSISLDDNYL